MAQLKFIGLKKKKKSFPEWLSNFPVLEKAEETTQLLAHENDDTCLFILGSAAWRVAEPSSDDQY